MNKKSNIAEIQNQTEGFDVEKIREDFPILHQEVNGKPLVYLDNAATSQKPKSVIDSIEKYYRGYNSNIHRGVHTLSENATEAYESARIKVRDFIHANSTKEIVFVRGATEAINLVAQSFGRNTLGSEDEIIITELEHHANIVPWQLLSQQTGAKLKYVPINDNGELVESEYKKLLNEKTRIVAVGHISNALGTINPIENMINLAHEYGAKVLIDGAQATSHTSVDVKKLDCDFYVFSGHKLFGPTGIGVLYGKEDLLEKMPPYQGGGDMIKMVTMKETQYNELPHKFEAGTPNISGVIGLGAAIDYVNKIGLENIGNHEKQLLDYANQMASEITGLKFIGTAKNKTSILSFTLDGIHPHDVGTILNNEGIAIRTGHHCAMPVMEYFQIPATSRASFSFYNTHAEVDVLIEGINKCSKVFN
ncbi:MAG: cysteine desulfurase CsdA [Legionellales bacterium]|jgi:cysteine desulfurase/selenocysteine lyase|nr:cysteine desulfurase CsdA [Legionellales bacterium]|tara:strand:+ start:968 stop:2230 length:1263 start_codon:yes stop_codon:yes gene_type:complete